MIFVDISLLMLKLIKFRKSPSKAYSSLNVVSRSEGLERKRWEGKNKALVVGNWLSEGQFCTPIGR